MAAAGAGRTRAAEAQGMLERWEDLRAAKAHLVRWYDLTRSACDEPVGRDSKRERTRDRREPESGSTGQAAGMAGEALQTRAARMEMCGPELRRSN